MSLCRSFLLLVLLTLTGYAQELLPFGDDFVPQFSFVEDYREKVIRDPEDPVEFIDAFESRLVVDFEASMKGIPPATFGEGTTMVIDIGNLLFDLDIDDAVSSVEDGFQKYVWKFDGTDPATFDTIEDACVVTLRFNATKLFIKVTSADVHEDFNILAPDEAGGEETYDKFPILVDVAVGDYGFTGRTCYIAGTAKLYDQDFGDEETAFGLADVDFSGQLDVKAPTNLLVTFPATRDIVSANPVTVTGNFKEDYFIKAIEVSVNSGPFVPATITSETTWSLAGVTLIGGRNSIIARAEDQEGNITLSDAVTPRFSATSQLKVNASGTGSGKVTSEFFDPVVHAGGQPSPVKSVDLVVGDVYTVTAKGGANSAFNGWLSNAPLTPAQASSPKLVFTMQPLQTLTATFVPNPFGPVQGKYSGLVTAEDAADRGLLTGKVSAKGAFTLQARIGKLTIPLKGLFTGSGVYAGQAKHKGQTYVVQLQLNLSGTGAQQITGTIVGGDINAAVAIDRSTFKKKTNPVPTELVGTFNVILPPDTENEDVNYPQGIGFGRVTVKVNGKVKFVGKLADGTALSLGTTLSAERTWPFFAALYKKTGSISGVIAFDLANEDHDLSGALDWFKLSGFSGESQLSGARFTPGQLSFLTESSGAGEISFLATGLEETLSGTLGANGTFAVTPDGESTVQNVTCNISLKTGLVSGSFVEAGSTKKFQGAVVGPKLDQMGAFFLRNGASGAVSIAGETVIE